ncbi:type II secretion system F family protein [Vampirovibrio sp.]|uniref:type II secretion system F family protein n=1 Tax=Vampirovibrio sp. TaxID=2717857 RepID=UPI003593F93C
MASFQYEAMKISDRTRANGVISAATEKEARELLREQNLIPTKIAVISSDTKGGKKNNFLVELIQGFMGISSKDKIAFTRNMGMMIRAGIPVTEALMYYENYASNPRFRKIVARIRQDILAGYSLSQALGKHKKVFDDVYVNVTKAGERSGELDQTMSRLTDMLMKAEALKMKIISASIYPIIVVVILSLVLLIMFLLVLPTFSDIYKQMNVPLPFITQVMMGISFALRSYWFVTFPLLGGVLFGAYKFLSSPTGKTITDQIYIKLPVLGDLIKHIQSSHFVSTLFIAFGAGLPITDALSLSTETLTHTQIKAAFKQVNVQIQTGQRLAISLANTGYVPDIVMLMISTGEESGDLEKMLEASYDYLEEEVSHRVGILTTLMEPIMLLVIGAVVGFVALSIYLPLFSIYDHLG